MTQSISINQDLKAGGSQSFRDFLGIAASVLCAIHCAAMPFVVGFLPLLGLSFLADPSFHKWMVGVCLVLALLAFVPGWRRHHRLQPTLIGLCGLGLITFAAFAGPEDCCPTPCAASTVAADPSGSGSECVAACCATDAPGGADAIAPAPVAEQVEVAKVSDAEIESSCAATCCSTGAAEMTCVSGPEPVAVLVEDGGSSTSSCCGGETPVAGELAEADSGCAAACCPAEQSTMVTAGTGGFMELFWVLMTPVGGVILVAAHLVNHRLSCRCSAGCCA